MIRTITKSLLYTGLFTGIFLVVLGAYILQQTRHYTHTVYPNVTVNGASFAGKTSEDIEAYFQPRNEALKRVVFEVRYRDSVATFSGETIHLTYDTPTISKQAMLIGRSPRLTSRLWQQLVTILNFNTFDLEYMPAYDLAEVKEYIAELEEDYNIPAQDARFTFENGKVSEFKIEKDGKRVNSQKALSNITTYLSQREMLERSYADMYTIDVQDIVLKPKITLADSNSLGIEEKIGEGKSNYTGSSAEREYNVLLAASRFQGVLIPPGEELSYNKIVGDISQATGFKTAYVIKNGRTVLGDGGGICQDSTTLFRAALNTGLPIIERHAHAYRVKYYENDSKPGFDATVYGPTVDLRIKNDTPAHILIQVITDPDNNLVSFEFYGKRDGRSIELSDPVVYDVRPAPEPLYEDNPTMPKGTTKQVDWAAPGAKSSFSYKVTHADGTVTQDRTFLSVYRPWRAVYQVGTL